MIIPFSDENTYHHRTVVNYVLIGLNVLVFIIINGIIGTGETFLSLALVPSSLQIPDLLTSMFLHAGLFHIFGNMLFLWIAGDNVEAGYGYAGYPFFYIVTGALAGLSHVLLNPGSQIPMVGASGAISGVLGAYLVLCPKNKIRFWYFFYYMWGTFEVRAIYAILVYFGMQVVYWLLLAPAASISYEAHIGGFASGVAITYACVVLGIAKPERPHAWVRAPAYSKEPRYERHERRSLMEEPSRFSSRPTFMDLPRAPEPGESIPVRVIPQIPKRVKVRGRPRSPRAVHVKDPRAYAVIRLDDSPIDISRVGKVVAEHLNEPLADSTSRIATTRGFIVEEAPRATAEAVVTSMTAEGVHTAAVPCGDLLRLPRAIRLRTVEFHDSGLNSRTEWEEFSLLWKEIRLVSCGVLRVEQVQQRQGQGPLHPHRSVAFGIAAMTGMAPYIGPVPRSPRKVSISRTTYRDEIVIDIFPTDEKLRFRFWQGRFSLRGLGVTGAREGMRELARQIVDRAPGIFLSPAVGALARGERLLEYNFGDRPSFERHNRYLFLLERHVRRSPDLRIP